jgi:hypothetical protein
VFNTEKRCSVSRCDSNVMNRTLVGFIAYGCSALVLAVPFLNAAGANVQNTVQISELSISWTAVFLFVGWIISWLVTLSDRHESPVACAVHACGIPGLIIGSLTAIQAL